jgi:hypothetical protein
LVVMLWICAVIDMHALLARRAVATNVRATYSTAGAISPPSSTESIADAAVNGESGVRHRAAHSTDAAPRHVSIGKRPPRGLRAYTEDEIQNLIRVYAEEFGIDPAIPLAIARCESQFHWDAANRVSSARGVFQYVAGTWATTPEGRRGTSPFDAEANIRMALTHMMTIGTGPWNASRECWDA